MAWALLHCQAPEILLGGPAGTGKSCAALYKLHLICDNLPRVRALIVRQTRASLTESGLVTFEQFVVPPAHPCLSGPSRGMRRAYHYPNGSTIALAGLDKPGKIMSAEFDLVYVQEAIEVAEEAWEALTTRLRNGVLPYQQLLADTNPDRPTHWLKRRCDAGRTVLLESRHEDNPRLWDAEKNEWTDFARRPDGTGYLDRLDALTGPRKARLRHGRWVQAEGLVYDGWDPALHVIDRFAIPGPWPRYWSIDFGFTNPFVCQWWAEDPDGRLYLYRELYQTQLLVEDAAREVLALSRDEPRPRAVICDHDAEDRATLTRHLGIDTERAIKDVSPGIQAVAGRLRAAQDGRPRLFVLRDALVRRDPALVEAKKPACLAEELDGYCWDTSSNRKQGEEPIKKDDHGADAARYLIAFVDRPQPLMDIIPLALRAQGALSRAPDTLQYPGVRYFPPTQGFQPLPVLRGELVPGAPDFRTEEQAGAFLHVFARRMGQPAPAFALPGLDTDGVRFVEERVEAFCRSRRLI